MTRTIVFKDTTINKMKSILKLFFKEDTLVNIYDMKDKKDKKYIMDRIKKIAQLYEKLDIRLIVDELNKVYPNHKGYPLHPRTGRPLFSHLKCLYENCKFECKRPHELDFHLRKNVNNFIMGYHQMHVDNLSIIEKLLDDTNSEIKCPIPQCEYKGCMKLHLKQLGIKPYWVHGDKFSYVSHNKFNIYETDTCMVCLDCKPDVLQSCGHKINCIDCYEQTIRNSNSVYAYRYANSNNTCMVCRTAIKYIFIM